MFSKYFNFYLAQNKKGFTLIELLVVVAIIGILAAVGVVAFTGFMESAKKRATVANFKNASRFIETTLIRCDLEGGTINLSDTISIDCNATNNTSNVNSIADSFMNYFISSGFKNPYNSSEPAIIRTGSGGDNVNGRLRLDETECSSGSGKKKIALWYKVHDENPSPKLFEMSSWCN